MTDLATATDDELRAEARRRDMELHSKEFSLVAQDIIRRGTKVEIEVKALRELAQKHLKVSA